VERISNTETGQIKQAVASSNAKTNTRDDKNQTKGLMNENEDFDRVLQNFPVRVYKYQDDNLNFKLEIKFRKTADKENIRKALEQTLANL
jgi:hypothetical protein